MKNTGLKFLVDAGVGKNAEEHLSHKGYDTKTVRSINPHMEDEEILEIAFSEKRMVITMDKDFGELVYHSASDKTGENPGVLLLRPEDAGREEKKQVVAEIIEKYSEKIKNCFCVYMKVSCRDARCASLRCIFMFRCECNSWRFI